MASPTAPPPPLAGVLGRSLHLLLAFLAGACVAIAASALAPYPGGPELRFGFGAASSAEQGTRRSIILFGDSITQRALSPDGGWGARLADAFQRLTRHHTAAPPLDC